MISSMKIYYVLNRSVGDHFRGHYKFMSPEMDLIMEDNNGESFHFWFANYRETFTHLI